jgi:NADPH-dependent glutamate synthase beta subunit-like oxidoreductase
MRKAAAVAEIIPGSEEVIACDAVIVAFGFAPHAMPWLESVGVTTDRPRPHRSARAI